MVLCSLTGIIGKTDMNLKSHLFKLKQWRTIRSTCFLQFYLMDYSKLMRWERINDFLKVETETLELDNKINTEHLLYFY